MIRIQFQNVTQMSEPVNEIATLQLFPGEWEIELWVTLTQPKRAGRFPTEDSPKKVHEQSRLAAKGASEHLWLE